MRRRGEANDRNDDLPFPHILEEVVDAVSLGPHDRVQPPSDEEIVDLPVPLLWKQT